MTRARVGYEFCPMPRRFHAVWAGATQQAEWLVRRLFELNDGGPITVTGDDWMTSVCKQLAINGRDRSNVRKSLIQYRDKGAIQVVGDQVTVCFLPTSSCAKPSTFCAETTPSCAETTSTHDVPFESNDRNHSTHKSQTDRQTEETERVRARARESSARFETAGQIFERPPVGDAPPELPKPAANPPSWLRVWQLFAEHRNLDPLQLGHPGRQQEALQSIAASAEVESGGGQGEAFDRAVQRLLGAWSADKWVKEKQPTLANLAANLHRYARAKAKPVVKLVGAPLRADECWSDEELLAWPDWKEGDLSIWQKQRRWELQARDERKAGAGE